MVVCTGGHKRPVHFNRGIHGHIWACIACGKQMSGAKLPEDEVEVLCAYANVLVANGRILKAQPSKLPMRQKEENTMETNTMQLTFNIKAGASPADIAATLRFQAGLFEGMDPKAASSRANTDTVAAKKTKALPVDAEADDEDEDFNPKKKASAKKAAVAAAFDADDEDETEDEDFSAPPKKASAKAKNPAYRADDVNDACKIRAAQTGGKEGRAEVMAILKKFKVASVSELKPEQYGAVIEAMTGE